MKIKSWGFMDNSWSLYKGFYCSLSEAQKRAEDKGQIKALLGGLPVTQAPIKCKCGSKNSRYLLGISLRQKPSEKQKVQTKARKPESLAMGVHKMKFH